MAGTEWMGKEKAPIPPNEVERLEALSRYETLDADPAREEGFDRLAELAAQFCDVPVSFINLIGEDKEFKKACYGFEGQTTNRTDSICQFTIMQNDVFEVKDCHNHHLFKNNPNVHGDLKLRYYAGISLKTPDGYNIGTLCLIDFKPNELTKNQKEALKTLSSEIVARYELDRVRRQLEKNNAEKDELIRIVSHDMRNPLTGILGFSELMLQETENEDHREMLASIENAGEAMLNIVNVLLNSDYIRNQAFILNLKQTDIAELTKEVIHLHKPFAMMKNQQLYIEVEEPLECKMDKEKWKQIVGNLLSNAIKFTPVGGEITLKLARMKIERPFIELVVKDTGIGLPKDKLEDLFTGKESIRREGTSGEQSTGLGMYIIKKYISLLRGKLDVQSDEGLGTVFTLQIPV